VQKRHFKGLIYFNFQAFFRVFDARALKELLQDYDQIKLAELLESFEEFAGLEMLEAFE